MDDEWVRRTITAEEWLRNIQEQPEAVAELLAFESTFGQLRADERGQVWHGNRTTFRLSGGE